MSQVKIPCCPHLVVSSSGVLGTNQGAAMGGYSHAGDFNGHPYYTGGHEGFKHFLFYRKRGAGPNAKVQWQLSLLHFNF